MLSQLSLFSEQVPCAAKFPSTRYQGSKQKFADWIWECIKYIPFDTALDAFGGTGCISFRLKEEGKSVTYNDILPFNSIIGKAIIENSNVKLENNEIETLLCKCEGVTYPTFIEDTFRDIYFTDEENQWLDVVSTNIRRMGNTYKQAIAYFALFQSCIIKRPYNLFHRKNLYVRLQDVERSFGNKKTWDTPFEVHFRRFVNEANAAVFSNGENCRALNQDIFDIKPNYDFVYIDTPYLNDNGIGVDYGDFYHFLNGLVDYENWHNHIDYNSKHLRLFRQANVWNNPETIHKAFEQLFAKFPNTTMAISYRSNGIPSIDEIVGMLENTGRKVTIHQSNDIKYVLSTKRCKEVLIVAQ